MSNYVSPRLVKGSPYQPGEQGLSEGMIKLNTNENPYPPSPLLEKALSEFDYRCLRFYPLSRPLDLIDQISSFCQVPSDQIVVGNGSDEILSLIVRAFCEVGDQIYTFFPGYTLFDSLASFSGADVKRLMWVARHDKDILKHFKGRILYLVRPHSPTGELLDKKLIRQWCQSFSSSLIVIDEAYVDFSIDNCLDILSDFDNVILVRTLSKSFSLAGIRLGWAMGSVKNIQYLNDLRDSYNINMLTQKLAQVALEDVDYMESCVKRVIQTREKVSLFLKSLDCEVCDSQSNFIYFRHLKFSGMRLYEQLKERGIVVRHFNFSGYRDYVRVTVGTENHMDTFVEKIKEILL